MLVSTHAPTPSALVAPLILQSGNAAIDVSRDMLCRSLDILGMP